MNPRGIISPKYTIPPTPPTIHRKLLLTKHHDGLVISPLRREISHSDEVADRDEKEDNGEAAKAKGEFVEGVMIGWGVRGEVKGWEGEVVSEGVEIGGVLGVVRLWDSEPSVFFSFPTPVTRCLHCISWSISREDLVFRLRLPITFTPHRLPSRSHSSVLPHYLLPQHHSPNALRPPYH